MLISQFLSKPKGFWAGVKEIIRKGVLEIQEEDEKKNPVSPSPKEKCEQIDHEDFKEKYGPSEEEKEWRKALLDALTIIPSNWGYNCFKDLRKRFLTESTHNCNKCQGFGPCNC